MPAEKFPSEVCTCIVKRDTQHRKIGPPSAPYDVSVPLEAPKDGHVQQQQESADSLAQLVLEVTITPLTQAEQEEGGKNHDAVLHVVLIQQ